MEFATQTEAKKFFVEKIILEANQQGIFLTESQRYMLSWSESDPNFKINAAMNTTFKNENTDYEYEKMIRKLMKKAFERDTKTDKILRDDWRKAYSVLKKGDHYILVMLKDALGSALVPWWKITF
jgi:Leu/Phe-tRNA-protein transferase